MKVLLVHNSILPIKYYGGTERIVWDLAKALTSKGYQIEMLLPIGSKCPFAKVKWINPEQDLSSQISNEYDLVHFHFIPKSIERIKLPYIITIHGNPSTEEILDKQSVFVSENHAFRYGSKTFVYNGLDWNDFPKPNLETPRDRFHFLGKAAWRIKNLRGAIRIILASPGEKLDVMGGYRVNFKMGFRFTLSSRIRFYGMVNNSTKAILMNKSKGLIFPVLWHEPFGLAIIESFYSGCPVYGSPYGSLPELVKEEFGFLSHKEEDHIYAIQYANQFSKLRLHQYASEMFNSEVMTKNYLRLYEKVINGQILNQTNPKLCISEEPKFLSWG